MDVSLDLDYGTGEVIWTFRMLDPNTGELPEDVFAGFLPPNDDTHRGEGYVSFTIAQQPDLPLGTDIRNQASIVFDTNEAIVTNEVFNTLGYATTADVDGSGVVDSVDIQLVINKLLGIPVEYFCDIDGDGNVTSVDAQMVINTALGVYD